MRLIENRSQVLNMNLLIQPLHKGEKSHTINLPVAFNKCNSRVFFFFPP